jgi:isocitrate/isopropylmalate dehydrogenase
LVIADKKNHTRDLGGSASTSQVGDAVCSILSEEVLRVVEGSG